MQLRLLLCACSAHRVFANVCVCVYGFMSKQMKNGTDCDLNNLNTAQKCVVIDHDSEYDDSQVKSKTKTKII